MKRCIILPLLCHWKFLSVCLSVFLSEVHLQSICSDFPKLDEGPEGYKAFGFFGKDFIAYGFAEWICGNAE